MDQQQPPPMQPPRKLMKAVQKKYDLVVKYRKEGKQNKVQEIIDGLTNPEWQVYQQLDSQFISVVLAEFHGKMEKHIDARALRLLEEMLKQNVAVFDLHHIKKRTLELIDRIYSKISFSNKAILEARSAFLKTLIGRAADSIPELHDFKEDVDDLTKKRNVACEPVCREALVMIFDENAVDLSDSYLKTGIEEQEMLLMSIYTTGFAEKLFELMSRALDESYTEAVNKLWNGASRTFITMKQVDEVLNSGSDEVDRSAVQAEDKKALQESESKA